VFFPWPELERRFSACLRNLPSGLPARVTDLRASAVTFFVHYLQQAGASEGRGPVLLITETSTQAGRLQQFLSDVARLVDDREPEAADYLVFPDYEPQNLFEYTTPALDVLEARTKVLDALRAGTVRVVVTSYKACWRRLPDPAELNASRIELAQRDAPAEVTGQRRLARGELARRLAEMGYQPVTTVTAVGEFALHGGIVDVFPNGDELPLRLDLFGDELDELHRFDPETQRTVETVDAASILPLSTLSARLSEPGTLAWLRRKWDIYCETQRELLSPATFERLEQVVQSDLATLERRAAGLRAGWYEEATTAAGVGHPGWCLWHYLPEGSTVVVHEDSFVDSETASYFRFWHNRFADWERNGLSFLGLDEFYLQPSGGVVEAAVGLSEGCLGARHSGELVELAVPQLRVLLTNAYGAPEGDSLHSASLGFDNAPPGKWGTSRLADTLGELPRLAPDERAQATLGLKLDRPVSILSQFSARLREILDDAGVHPEIASAILPGGFVIPPVAGQSAPPCPWTVVTDMEVFGEIAEVAPKPTRRYRKEAYRKPAELTPGDYVVHIDYGIGRFAQLTERSQSGVTKSYVEIEYAGRDRLYVPVEQLDRLRRYSFDGSEPKLSNLGRELWRKTKEKVQRETLELARRLLSLYKTRQIRPGYAFSPNTVWQEEFADAFPYILTEDQLVAWRDVEQDMEAERPMDRLLCGDVGFGKTEIAMRAAFKACVDERQVLLLCPTTVLADQHYTTFGRRFRPFPFRVALLSRFQTKPEQRDVVEKVKSGRIDVVIATHRALSKDVDFLNLGLLVIDEEQRFGVKQKEALKLRWPLVDVLAMSATPIPRTLHMSLIGLRDISLIETAPLSRKAVKTYVGEHDEVLVRDALQRELGRGGQVYFLHNRVQSIEGAKAELERLVLDHKIIVAHGQMREDRLEEVMHAFSLGAYKVMLATTIIENGLDIPAVNTIVVTGAENLGLAQMHQLRGRVGRSAAQAYAYFFHTPNRLLTDEARRRLHAIYNYAYLGAGYEIAQSDLRIRGAGNLLGEAQSGLAKMVGFEYYCELLASSINDIKALDVEGIEDWEDRPLVIERPGTQLDLPLPSFIPESYIDDPVLRLEVLRDMAQLDSEQALEDFVAGLEDRFGPPPEEVVNLLSVVQLKNLATACGIERLSYSRVKRVFSLAFFEDEQDWYKRALLQDSRLSIGGPHAVDAAIPFDGPQSCLPLAEMLESLRALREGA
jgi:transcription-repair coupling factor (superfamily II helicase)